MRPSVPADSSLGTNQLIVHVSMARLVVSMLLFIICPPPYTPSPRRPGPSRGVNVAIHSPPTLHSITEASVSAS
ncbi:hypothetical protein J6590_038906 [Homalodisca vitripennis]|nr:hypothetical protein J6590_038906 [Homalodisca vitripennis]